jgi:YCII-related domain-containing protein
MENELNERERVELARMSREIEPPAALQDRVIGDLRRSGLLRPRRAAMIFAVAAALVAGFIGGLLLPRMPRPPRQHREFILLVHDTPSMRVDGAEGRRADEYRRWAQQLRARGTLTGGEKLTDDVSAIGTTPQHSDLGGFFRIVARDRADAEAVARTCPHIRHGGWIEVREIDHG